MSGLRLYGLLCIMIASSAAAQSFTPAPGGSFAIDFDSDEGTYSNWEAKDLRDANAVRATVKVPRLRNHERWAPGFSIYLKSVAKSEVWFQLYSPTRAVPLLAKVMTRRDDKLISEIKLNTTIGLNQELEVEFDWTPTGKVKITVGKEVANADLQAPVSALVFGGSTGEVQFNPILLGTVSP